MLASKEQRTQTPFCESERPLAKIWALLNQIFRGAMKAGIPRRISQRTVWAQTGSDCTPLPGGNVKNSTYRRVRGKCEEFTMLSFTNS